MSPSEFSIVVPVHNVRAWLRECLDSILGQSFRDFDLIAVDDASPDGSGDILDEYALADSRVRVLHLAENVGLGPARDIGIDAATGRYVLFVDGDDTLTPGALAAIAERIRATDEPEILVFDYARTYWNGRVQRNISSELVAQTGPDVFPVSQRPDLLTLLMVVWNKAYRLDFIREHGFRFTAGYYEDLPWTYPTMLTAHRIAVLDRVCYHYRQRRHGNILRSANRRHFDVFDQYARVFGYLDARPELESWRPFLFNRMVTHISANIVTNRRRIARPIQREFFDALVAAYERHVPAGYQPPSGRQGIKQRAIARGDYRAFLAVDALGRAERGTKLTVRRAEAATRPVIHKAKRAAIKSYYHVQLRAPIDDHLVVYSAYWSHSYACNPAAIYEAAKELTPHLRGVWVIRRDRAHTMPSGVEYVELFSPEYYRVMATAKYFVNNVNFLQDIVKRPGAVWVQTQHGTPLKTMGLGLLNYPIGAARMNFPNLMKRSDRWDYVISSNRFSSEVWERSFPNDYVTLETGYPRNDRLVRATAKEVAELRGSLGLAADRTVVLYAPTFRDWSREQFESPADLADLCERLGESFVVLVRAHYFAARDERLERLEQRGMLRDVSEYPVVEDLMLASDVLLTDYSSIMFDYANLDRPIVIFAPDWEAYLRVRGVNMDLLAAPPGVVATTQDDLVDALVSGRYREPDAEALRKKFAERFCQFDDGHAAERVVRRVFLGEQDRAAGANPG